MSSRSDEHVAEVFRWLEHTILLGAVVGAVAAVAAVWIGSASQLEPSVVVAGVLVGAAAGAVVGFCLVPSWAVEAPARSARRSDLWDPWLDAVDSAFVADPPSSRLHQEAVFEIAGRVNRSRARVKPRVISSETGESLPIEDLVAPILAGAESGAIRISGRSGCGKTTALAHLSGLVPPHLRVSFLDNPGPRAIASAVERGWAVFTCDIAPARGAVRADLRLAPWGKDEWIEYLLATDHRQCGSVIARLDLAKAEASRLDGNAELWRLVLDRMLIDTLLTGPRQVIQCELTLLLPDLVLQRRIFRPTSHAAPSQVGEATFAMGGGGPAIPLPPPLGPP